MHDRAAALAVTVLLFALVLGITAPTQAARIQILVSVIVLGLFWAIVDNRTR